MKKKASTVVMFLFLASSVGALGFYGYKIYLAQKAREQARVEQVAEEEKAEKAEREKRAKEQAAEAARIAAEQAAELAKIQELATLGKSEGPEHPLIRQLVYNPDIMSGVKVKIGQKKYDLAYLGGKSDKKAVKKWAGRTAHLLAIFAGYVDLKTGRQIRVKKAGEAAYLITVDKNKQSAGFDIYQKEVKATEAEFTYLTDVNISWSDGGATFWGDVKNGLTSFEYVWTPALVKGKKQKK